MPTLDKVITENSIHIINPVADQIVRSLLRYMGIYHIFKDNGLYIESANASATNTETETHSDKVNIDRCDVEIVPNLNPSDTKWDAYTYQLHRSSDTINRAIFGDTPIFYDKRADIYLHEVAVPCSVELNFKLRVRSRELSEMIYSSIFSKFDSGSNVHTYNDISYSYPIADNLLLALYKFYKMRVIENKPSFRDYLKYGSDDRFDILVNRTDETLTGDQELVIRKSSNYVLGQLEFSQSDPKENAEKKAKFIENYGIEFTYTYQFSRPSLLRLHYPAMIDNQMVPKELMPVTAKTQLENSEAGYRDISISSYAGNDDIYKFTQEFYKTTRYPGGDDWVIPYVRYRQLRDRYSPLFIGMLSVDVDPVSGDTSLTVDMDEIFTIFDTRLKDYILEYFKINIFGNLDLFNITIFANDIIVDPTSITITGNTATVTERIRTHIVYRIVISVAKDISYMSRTSIGFMLDHYEDFLPMITANFNYLLIYKYIQIIETLSPNRKLIEINPHGLEYNLLGEKYGISKAFRVGNYIIKSRRQPPDYRQ